MIDRHDRDRNVDVDVGSTLLISRELSQEEGGDDFYLWIILNQVHYFHRNKKILLRYTYSQSNRRKEG